MRASPLHICPCLCCQGAGSAIVIQLLEDMRPRQGVRVWQGHGQEDLQIEQQWRCKSVCGTDCQKDGVTGWAGCGLPITLSICMCESSRGTVVRTSHETTPGEYEYTCERRGAAVRMPSCAYFLLTSTYLRKRPAKSEEKKISYGCNSEGVPGDKDSVRSVCLRLTQTHIESRTPSPPSRLGLQSTSDPRPPNISQHRRRRASKPRPPRRATPTITQERLTRGPGRKEYMLHNELLKAS